MKKCSQFGMMIKEVRERRNIPVWKFASLLPFPQSNVHRIENGLTEPRIGLAMRMLEVLELDAGSFMDDMLARLEWGISPALLEFSWQSFQNYCNFEPELFEIKNHMLTANPFGSPFRQVRLGNNLSQKTIGEYAGYTTRSLIAVENGHQEPALGTALRLVWASGCDISWFFRKLQILMAEKNPG